MSMKQIVRDFPFLKHYLHKSDQGSSRARVSRLSLDALGLTMELGEETFTDYFLQLIDEEGDHLLDGRLFAAGDNDKTIGDVLVWNIDSEEFAGKIHYILYETFEDVILDERSINKSYSFVLFKMPKTISLWDLLQKYRKNKKNCVNQ